MDKSKIKQNAQGIIYEIERVERVEKNIKGLKENIDEIRKIELSYYFSQISRFECIVNLDLIGKEKMREIVDFVLKKLEESS